ncbi:MAG: hypothetical protein ACLRZZ_27590 [Enterocloster sp.]
MEGNLPGDGTGCRWKLALEGRCPFSGNAYKIDVAETLVRRSLDWSGKDE